MGFRLYSEKTPFSPVLLKNLDRPLGVPSFLIEFMIKKLAFFKKWNNRFLPSKRYSNNIKKFFLPDILAFYKMDIHFFIVNNDGNWRRNTQPSQNPAIVLGALWRAERTSEASVCQNKNHRFAMPEGWKDVLCSIGSSLRLDQKT